MGKAGFLGHALPQPIHAPVDCGEFLARILMCPLAHTVSHLFTGHKTTFGAVNGWGRAPRHRPEGPLRRCAGAVRAGGQPPLHGVRGHTSALPVCLHTCVPALRTACVRACALGCCKPSLCLILSLAVTRRAWCTCGTWRSAGESKADREFLLLAHTPRVHADRMCMLAMCTCTHAPACMHTSMHTRARTRTHMCTPACTHTTACRLHGLQASILSLQLLHVAGAGALLIR